jgi:hypothetical protein
MRHMSACSAVVLSVSAGPHPSGIPCNPAFTGRERLLVAVQRPPQAGSKGVVLPHALHGFGGVGKT